MSKYDKEIEDSLWQAADSLRANSKLKSSEYSGPVLGLIFLRYADYKFGLAAQALAAKTTARRQVQPSDYQALGVMYLPADARFSRLVQLPEGRDIGGAINKAMSAIEQANPALKDTLPKTYQQFDKGLLGELLRRFDAIPLDKVKGDIFGKIYEYFLGEFAMSEGQKGGEFFTPTALVRLIVEVIEPYRGKVYDPACGSGGMFVQSARFVAHNARRRNGADPSAQPIAIYGQERTDDTVRLCKMNLAVNGLEGMISAGNSYYDDPHHSAGAFDFVMANPPFNVNQVDTERIKDDTRRFPFGMPKTDNANTLWIQLFYSSLNAEGRAGFVMANSAADARGSEMEIRRKLIEAGAVDVMISIGPNFFYTVTLPCTLWFFDRRKARTKQVLFIDARQLYRQVDRAHRDFKSGCEEKWELEERFPLLPAIPGLLAESPIDEDMWDWAEASWDEAAQRALLEPAAEGLLRPATELASACWPLEQYRKQVTGLHADAPQAAESTLLALARYAALNAPGGLDGRAETTEAVRLLNREFSAYKRNGAKADFAPNWQAEQAATYKRKAEAIVLDALKVRGLIFDRNRATLPLDDATPAESLRTAVQADVEQVVVQWRKTRGTNHIKIIRDIVRAYRGEPGAVAYADIAGLCKVATVDEIAAQGWSLNPGRYVGVAERAADDFEFKERLEELNEELEVLNAEAHELEVRIAENIEMLLSDS